MAIKDISYVSLAVKSIDDSIEDFRRTYGLQQVSPINYNRGFGWLRVVLGNGPEAFLELLQPTDPKPAVGRFLERRGEGVYLFSFTVDDMAATVRHLRELKVRFATAPDGARPERVRTIWIHPRATTGVFIELNDHLMENEYAGFGEGSASSSALLRELNYVATVVRDVEEATTLYQEVLGLEVTSPRNTEAGLNFERVVMGVGGRGLLELMQPNDPTSTMGRYLDRQGEGPYMASFLVDDPAAAAEQVNARGGSATPDERYGAFVHPRTNHGLLVQLAGNYLTGSTG